MRQLAASLGAVGGFANDAASVNTISNHSSGSLREKFTLAQLLQHECGHIREVEDPGPGIVREGLQPGACVVQLAVDEARVQLMASRPRVPLSKHHA